VPATYGYGETHSFFIQSYYFTYTLLVFNTFQLLYIDTFNIIIKQSLRPMYSGVGTDWFDKTLVSGWCPTGSVCEGFPCSRKSIVRWEPCPRQTGRTCQSHRQWAFRILETRAMNKNINTGKIIQHNVTLTVVLGFERIVKRDYFADDVQLNPGSRHFGFCDVHGSLKCRL